jgi:hypothetical protein
MFSQSVIENIHKQYGYVSVDHINLAEYDFNHWDALYRRLEKLKRTTWLPEEKIFIHQFDAQFFLGNIGFSSYNFNLIIRHLDIDPSVFVILTTYYKSQDQWLQYCDHASNQFHIIALPFTEYLMPGLDVFRTFRTDCNYHFNVMIGTGRVHRKLLAKFLIQNNLVETNIVKINLIDNPQMFAHNVEPLDPAWGLRFLTTDPVVVSNEYWQHSKFLTELHQSIDEVPLITNSKISDYTSFAALYKQHNYTINSSVQQNWTACDWYQEVFVDIVPETVYNYPYACFSEKIMRPVIAGRPFVLVGAAHTIEFLHHLGFQTFNDYWNESYDTMTDPNQRFEAVCSVVKEIASWPIDLCRDHLKSMQPILQHNQEIYKRIITNQVEYVTN